MTLGLKKHLAGSAGRSSLDGGDHHSHQPDTTADDETVVDQDQGNGMAE